MGLSALILTTITIYPGDSRAVITSLAPALATSDENFQRSLEQLGHEPPRAYDLNGNTIYVAVNHMDRPARQVLQRYQQAFVEFGINDAVYLEEQARGTEAGMAAALTGGLVPFDVSDDYISMGGVVTTGRASNRASLARVARRARNGDVYSYFESHRFIEIFGSKDGQRSTVVATWSGKGFDYRKMEPGSRVGGQNPDAVVPACPGCRRVVSFADLQPGASGKQIAYESNASAGSTMEYFTDALFRRGFTPVGAGSVTAKLPIQRIKNAGIRRFVNNDGEQIIVQVLPGRHGGSLATISRHR